MSDDHRFPAPWERSLSNIRGTDSEGAAEAESGAREGADAEIDSGTDAGADAGTDRPDADAPGGRRRLGDADAPHGRLTVADLISRIGHPGSAADARPEGREEASRAGAVARRDDAEEPAEPETPADAEAPAGPEAPTGTRADTEPDSEPETENAGGPVPDAGPPPGDPPYGGPSADTAGDVPAGTVGAGTAGDTDEAGGKRSWLPTALPLAIAGHRHPRPGRRTNYWLRGSHIVIALVSVLALLGTGVVWSYLRITDSKYTHVSALDRGSSDVRNPAGQYGDENYLIVGTDTRAGANGDVGAGTSTQVEGARSDTIILVNIPASRKRVVAVSFPRDLNIDRPACEQWNNSAATYSDHMDPPAKNVKLNSAYSFGGPRCLVKVIQKLSGLEVNHFIGMDFAGFEAMVDTVGGVEVCTTRPLVDRELGTIIPTAGTHTISGQTALKYVRARKVPAEGNGDYGRIRRQQEFLSSLLRKALSNHVLLDPAKLNTFIDEFTQASFGDNLNTHSLITLARSLQNVDADQVTFLTVPTAGTDSWGNETPRLTDIRNLFDAIIDDRPLPGEQDDPADSGDSDDSADSSDSGDPVHSRAGAAGDSTASGPGSASPAQQVHAMAPGTVSVAVKNASSVNGFAHSTARQLSAQGFGIYSIGNHTAPVPTTIIQFSGDHEAAAATVASAFPGAKLQRTTGSGSVVTVLLADDSPRTLSTAVPAGSVLTPVLSSDSTQPGSVPLDVNAVNAGDTTCGGG